MNFQKINEGRFLLNNTVILSDLKYTENGVSYNMSYDEDIITKRESGEMVNYFMDKILNDV